ncbi:phosphoribosyltransferase [Massilia yuzhufengensis]|uniref:Putative phosphoribosyl transferase n=1 Tax=Massilia yuzhufengensis TaxID=1164594 RepID=A0A1I1QMZ6_9BURK|nr:phosphoribosyltransferase [Massilia yuzhufengensis]SFD21228.1 putative phosphoribosyl transferase [Massilia yuzhufengensis]
MPYSEGYKDRAHAGRLLARRLQHHAGQDDPIVLGLPRGGVPVAFEVAQALGAELDVLLVRKLGMPHHEEYAMGAIGSGGVRVLQAGVPGLMGVTQEQVDQVTGREMRELERRDRLYRGGRPPPRLAGRCVILVDDGIATGASMLAAVQVVRRHPVARLVVAAPVGAPDTVGMLEREVDEVVCPLAPPRFHAVGQYYRTFGQTGDEEVQDLLAQAWATPASPRGRH